MSSLRSPRLKNIEGFTLIEMVITLGIFLLLSAAVFGIISGVLRSASTLQDNQNRRDELTALNAYLNRQLRGMPASSTLISYRRGDGEGLNQNGIIFGRDENLTALDAIPQANGYYTIRLAIFDPSVFPPFSASPTLIFEAAVCRNDPKISWTPLIHDVRHLEWKFQVLNATEWLEMWSESSAKPNLVQFTMQQAGELQPATMDFWIQKVDPIALALPSQPTPTP